MIVKLLDTIFFLIRVGFAGAICLLCLAILMPDNAIQIFELLKGM